MIASPPRIGANGELVTIDDYSPQAATQLARAVVSTRIGEMPLAPAYGIPDPTDTAANPGVIAALVAMCEPELAVTDVRMDGGAIDVDVEWSNA